MVRLRPIHTTRKENFCLRGPALEHEIEKDIERGLIPFFVHATSGTTATASFDNIEEISKIAKKLGKILKL